MKLTYPATLVKFYNFKNGNDALFAAVCSFLSMCIRAGDLRTKIRTRLLFHIFDRKLRKTFA